MAKDILLDVNAGDLLLENGNGNVDYLDVVWGNLFSTDAKLYMNIVFPEGRQLDFVNNELVLCVSAKYKPSCSNFFIRLVYEGVDGTYSKISSVNARVAKEYAAYWRKTPVSVAEKLKASNLPYINIDGKYIVRIGTFDGVDCEVAFVYSAYNSDFVIGDADTQSAQLLTLCGPGKYYRYPTSGVDITKYINSIVANTDLGETLMREFDGDNKSISISRTLMKDTDNLNEIKKILLKLSQEIGLRARNSHLYANTIAITVRTSSFKNISHQLTLNSSTNNTMEIYEKVCELLRDIDKSESFRLLGIRLDNLTKNKTSKVSFFEEEDNDDIQKIMDNLNTKYKNSIIMPAIFYKGDK